jgi:DNA mismatch endonuclease, patch repair protein
MSDVLTPEQRSRCMSRIGPRDTKPEKTIRRRLWSMGLRYRINYPLPGKPDIVFRREKIAIFIDGCFWHRCPFHYQSPSTNAEFWEKKISSNVRRDREIDEKLSSSGWNVIRYWEHEVKENLERVVQDIIHRLVSKNPTPSSKKSAPE